MWWGVAATLSLLGAISYLCIAAAIVLPLVTSKQWRSNRLGVITGGIFVTFAATMGIHALALVTGGGLRPAEAWRMGVFGAISGLTGLSYWALRRRSGTGAVLFEDQRAKRQQALQINDDVVQGLTIAGMALELGQNEKAEEAIQRALVSARQMISSLLDDAGGQLRPGMLRRSLPDLSVRVA